MLDAANAFVYAEDVYKTIVFDDGCVRRELNGDEQRLLEVVCRRLGFEIEEIEG